MCSLATMYVDRDLNSPFVALSILEFPRSLFTAQVAPSLAPLLLKARRTVSFYTKLIHCGGVGKTSAQPVPSRSYAGQVAWLCQPIALAWHQCVS